MPEWDQTAFDMAYNAAFEGHLGGVPPGRTQEIRLGYHWFTIGRWQETDYAQKLIDVLGLTAGHRVLSVGCGYAWTGVGLAAQGIEYVGTEVSSLILGTMDQTEEADIRARITAVGENPDGAHGQMLLNAGLNGGLANPQTRRGNSKILDENLANAGSRNRVMGQLSAAPTHILGDEVINSIPDNEALTLCDFAENFRASKAPDARLIHMLSPYQVEERNGVTEQNRVQAACAAYIGMNWKTYAGWRAFLTANGFATQEIIPTVTAIGQGMHLPDFTTVFNREFAAAKARGDDDFTATQKATAFADWHVASERVEAYSGVF